MDNPKGEKKMKTQDLVEYMKCRAKFENRNWTIEDSWIENMFVQKGTRIFFGVVLDDLGNILRDEKQPEFYNNYVSNLGE
jgi:hypothetical protein